MKAEYIALLAFLIIFSFVEWLFLRILRRSKGPEDPFWVFFGLLGALMARSKITRVLFVTVLAVIISGVFAMILTILISIYAGIPM